MFVLYCILVNKKTIVNVENLTIVYKNKKVCQSNSEIGVNNIFRQLIFDYHKVGRDIKHTVWFNF